MKIVVGQHNTKFMTWAPVKRWFFCHVYYMNFNKAAYRKKSIFFVLFWIIRAATALIACANSSLETWFIVKIKEVF